MCIVKDVGTKGKAANKPEDVKAVQALLNENVGRLGPGAQHRDPLKIDGQIGDLTIEMILEFQKTLGLKQTSLVAPASRTLRELGAGTKPGLTLYKMQAIMTGASEEKIKRYFDPLVANMAAHQIATPLRMAHFLAQVGHESAHFRYTEELASGDAYNDLARFKGLGNTQPGDGPRFKGRGLIQLTGRANYTAYGKARQRDFLTEPNHLLIATDAHLAVDVACWFWAEKGLNAAADSDDLEAVTKTINGGYNGLCDRGEILQRAKWFLRA